MNEHGNRRKKPPSRTPKKRERRRNGIGLTRRERQDAMALFLASYARSANVTASCIVAGISRSTVHYWNEHDLDDFSKRYNIADKEADDAIEQEIHRRGIEGVDEPVIYKGEMQGVWIDDAGRPAAAHVPGAHLTPLTVKRYSDVLLIVRAKARMPSKYRDRVEHTGADGGPIQVEDARRKLYDLIMAQRGDAEDKG